MRKNAGHAINVKVVRISPVTAIAVTALFAPQITAKLPTINAPKGPVPIAAAKTPRTRPLISIGADVITMMLCIVAKPDIEKPPTTIIGSAIQNDGDNENKRIAIKKPIEPKA